MRTVAETAIFQRYAADLWSEAERDEFIAWIAANPMAGDVIPAVAAAESFVGRAQARENEAECE